MSDCHKNGKTFECVFASGEAVVDFGVVNWEVFELRCGQTLH